jgi:hypothetical protein
MLDSALSHMSQALNPLSYDEHRELGAEIQRSRAKLLHLGSVATSVYGKQSRAAFHFQKVNDAMDKLCDELQAQAEQDCPGLGAASFYR